MGVNYVFFQWRKFTENLMFKFFTMYYGRRMIYVPFISESKTVSTCLFFKEKYDKSEIEIILCKSFPCIDTHQI